MVTDAINNMEVLLSSGNSSSDRLTTRSGRIPELSLGLSLSDTSTQSFNHLISNVHSTICSGSSASLSSHVKPPPLLVFQDTGRHVTDHVTSLDQDFPGVNKVLQEMACFIKSSRNPILPNINTSTIHRPPLLSTLTNYPPIKTTTPEPLHLPNIPMRPFVPRLIDPKQVLSTLGQAPPPPLLLLKTDPLINNRQLLLLPQEIKEHCDNGVHVTMTTGQSQRRLRRHSYKENRQKTTPTNNEESINYSSLQLINTRHQSSNNDKPQSVRHSVTTPVLTPDPPVSIPDPPVLTPVLTPDPPVIVPDQLLTTPDPPVLIPDPPVLTPDSPVLIPESRSPLGPPNPVIIPDPPVIGSDPPITPDHFTSHQSVGVQCIMNDDTANNQYLIVTDIEDDDHTSTEGSCNIDIPNEGYYAVETPTKGSYDHVKYSNEFCNEHHLLGADNNNNDNDLMDKFKHLEDQLLTIEYKTCGIEQELTDSREVLRTIERLSTEETKIISNNQYNDDHTHQLPHPLISIPIPLPVVQDPVIDDHVQTVDKQYRTLTTVSGKDELKVWMKKRKKERMDEYKRERERLIAKERRPYTPQKQVINRGLISTETAGNNEAKRRIQRANDYANRLKDAEHLLSDIVTTPNKPPPSSPYRPIQSAILLNTLPGPSRKNHQAPSIIKFEPEDKGVIGKRHLSSVEGLSETEQLKMAEILDSNRHHESSVESSNIDWSLIDQLLLSV